MALVMNGLRWVKTEVLDSLLAEYERLGRPLHHCDLTPEAVVDFVGAHFAQSVGSATMAPPRPPAASPLFEAPAEVEPVPVFFTVHSGFDGNWVLQGFGHDGALMHEVASQNPGDGHWYSILYSDNVFYLPVPGQPPTPCLNLVVPVETESAPALPAGISASAAMLPGMTSVLPSSLTPGWMMNLILNRNSIVS